jgi:anti-anti-sigma factor
MAWPGAFVDTFARIVVYEKQPPLLRCAGEEVQATSGCRRRALSRAQSARSDLVVDLTELSFADASLMLDLANLARRLRSKGSRMLLRRPQPQIMRLIEMVGLLSLPSVAVEQPTAAL